MVIIMGIGKIIAKRRKEISMSQGRLAECVNKSQAHISGIESERDNPSIELLEKIAEALDCQLYIDLIPNSAQPCEDTSDSIVTAIEENITPEPQAAPTWVTLEQASSITIFSIALEKLRLEKNKLTPAEIKVLQGLIEMYQEEIQL